MYIKKSSCEFILCTQNHGNMKKGSPPACPPSGQGKPGFLGWIHGGSVHPPKGFFIYKEDYYSSIGRAFFPLSNLKYFVVIILNNLLQVGFHSSPAHAQGESVFRHPFVQQSRAKSEHKTGLKWGCCRPMGWPEIHIMHVSIDPWSYSHFGCYKNVREISPFVFLVGF